jgi:hypothetical protein
MQRSAPLAVDGREQRRPLLVRPAAVLQQRDGAARVGMPAAHCSVQRRFAVVVDGRGQSPPLLVRPAAVLQQRGDDDAMGPPRCAMQRSAPLFVDGREQRPHLLVRAAAVLQQCGDGAARVGRPAAHRAVQRSVALAVDGTEQRPPLLCRAAAVLQQRVDAGIVPDPCRCNVQRRVTDVVDGRDQRPPLLAPVPIPMLVRAATMRQQQRDDGVAPLDVPRRHVQRRVPPSVGGRRERQHLLLRAAAVLQQRAQGAAAPARCKVQQRPGLLVDASVSTSAHLCSAVLQPCCNSAAMASPLPWRTATRSAVFPSERAVSNSACRRSGSTPSSSAATASAPSPSRTVDADRVLPAQQLETSLQAWCQEQRKVAPRPEAVRRAMRDKGFEKSKCDARATATRWHVTWDWAWTTRERGV